MKIKELFDFLMKDYGLAYRYQKFTNCYGGVGAYVLTDMIDINGKTAREWLKEGVRSLW